MNTPGALFSGVLAKARYNMGRGLKELGLGLDRNGSKYTYDIAYLQSLSRHRNELPLYPVKPQTTGAWIAPNASLVGDVQISAWATLWYNVVARGELNTIRVGHFTSIGEGTSLNANVSMPVGVPQSVTIGKNVSIGSNCTIFSSIIDDDVVIGDNVVISEGAVIERGAQIENNTVVPPGRLIPAGQLWAGNPCSFVRDLTEEEKFLNYSQSYENGAANDEGDLWPKSYLKSVPQSDGETLDEYVERNYFRASRI